MYTKQQ